MRFPDIEYAKEHICYNPETGTFARLRPTHGARKGKAVQKLHAEGYYLVYVDYRSIKAHVLAWALTHGHWPNAEQAVVHKDENRLNNRLSNLELVERCPSYEARDLFTYDPEAGRFKWRYKAAKNGRPFVGCPGWRNGDGYEVLSVGSRQIFAHRIAYLFMAGSDVPKGHEIDHINGVVDDNRWCNLRLVRRSQNNMNSKIRHDNKSGVKGVCYSKSRDKWEAEIKADGKRWRLGRFDTLEEAAQVRKEAEERIFGEYSLSQSRGHTG